MFSHICGQVRWDSCLVPGAQKPHINRGVDSSNVCWPVAEWPKGSMSVFVFDVIALSPTRRVHGGIN